MLLEMGVLQALVARKEPLATAAELATATSCNELVISTFLCPSDIAV